MTMELDKMLRMAPRDLAVHMKTLTADDLKYIANAWDLSPLPTAATCEAARRYFAGEK